MHKLSFFLVGAIALMMTACNGNEPENSAPEGAIKGVYSVGPMTKVYFAQGNLCCDISSTKTWSFLPNQYSYLGTANEKINSTGTRRIDLFGWSTGNNPTESHTEVEYYTEPFVDWGINPISNGGNQPGLWRTLTQAEWVYLFYYRENAFGLFSLGTVNGVNGTILLPDNWPSNKMFDNAGKGLTDQGDIYYNINETNYEFYSYSGTEWQAMENAGAVFLPAAGFRHGKDVYSVGKYGNYWSATPYMTNFVYDLHFNPISLGPQYLSYRYYGQSVRLVQDVK